MCRRRGDGSSPPDAMFSDPDAWTAIFDGEGDSIPPAKDIQPARTDCYQGVLTTPIPVWYVRVNHATRRSKNRPSATPERWLSGRKRRFAKPLYCENGIGGSNPPLSAP